MDNQSAAELQTAAPSAPHSAAEAHAGALAAPVIAPGGAGGESISAAAPASATRRSEETREVAITEKPGRLGAAGEAIDVDDPKEPSGQV